MRVKLLVKKTKYAAIKDELTALGLEIDDDAEFVFMEANSFVDCLTCKKEGEIYRLQTNEIFFIESFSHDVFVQAKEGMYKVGERLWQLENMLDPDSFLRVSNSVIVAKDKIKSIKPALSQKFLLTMVNGSVVDVTRSYYYRFKEKMGF